jgi:NTE family protein
VLERLRIPVDVIAGTSMGAIVGGLYASGLSADELEQALGSIDWTDTFDDRPPRKDRPFRRKRDDDTYLVKAELGYGEGHLKLVTGLIQGQKIDLLLKQFTLPVARIEDFDRLPTPFRAVASDIATGKEVVLGQGDLARSIRASMSVPAIFAPVAIEGKLLVDGMVANNVPVNVARAMGAERLIVVDVGSPPLTADQITNVFGIASQLTTILSYRNTERQVDSLGAHDVLLRPELGTLGAGDFPTAMKVVPLGQAAAEEKLAALRPFSVSEGAYQRWLRARAARRGGLPTVQFVKLDNPSRLSDGVLKARLRDHLGKPLDPEALNEDIGAIYGLGNFESVRYEVVEQEGQTGIVVHVREKSWGPNYLQFGLELSVTDEGDASFNLGFLFKRTALNRLNGEFRTGVQIGEEPALALDLYQPLDYHSRYFVQPLLRFEKRNFNVFDEDGDRVGEFRVTRLGGELAAGRTFGTWGEFRVGLRRYTGDADVRSGEDALEGFDFESGEAYTRFFVDKLDSVNFPRSGYGARVEWTASRTELGADEAFDQVELGSLLAHSWGRHTGIVALRVSSTVNDTAPVQNLFRLGGFLRLSGLDANELTGQHAGLAYTAYMRRIGDIQLLPAYLGGSLEAGNVWQARGDIGFENLIVSASAFLGVDTPIGPLYLGLGQAEGGRTAAFLFLGRAFRE